MKKVCHIIPYDGIGGVELAARSIARHSVEGIDFRVEYLYPPASEQRGRFTTFNPWPMLRTTRRILASKPDLLIVSLWRSCIVAVLSKLFFRRLRLVLLLHFPSDVHWVDRILTIFVSSIAEEVWADSLETLNSRLPAVNPQQRRVISFVTRPIKPLPSKPVKAVFIFWGRLHLQKGLARALRIFSAVFRRNEDARFIIIGPDGGDLERLKKLVIRLELTSAVSFNSEMEFDAISELARSASFYFQTSALEGMAMSVVESMQLGLVPVVTPVGEIKNYCRHGENALLVTADEVAVDEIVELLNNDALYQRMRGSAVATWAGKAIYAESVLQACQQMLLKSPNEPRLIQ